MGWDRRGWFHDAGGVWWSGLEQLEQDGVEWNKTLAWKEKTLRGQRTQTNFENRPSLKLNVN